MEEKTQLKHTLIYMLPKAVTGFFPILGLAIYTRFLTQFDFGVFALAEACALFLSGIVNFGMIIGFERNFFKYQDTEEKRALLYSTMSFVLVLFAIAAIFTYLFKGLLSNWIIRYSGHGSLIFVLFCSTVFASLNQYYYIYFRSDGRPKIFVFYTSIFGFLNVVLPVAFIVFAHMGIMGLAVGQLIAGLIIFTALGVRFLKEVSFSFDFKILKEVLKISYPLTPRIFFGVINAQISKYILAIMSSVGGVGLFAVAQKLSNLIFTFIVTLQNVFFPGVYKQLFSKEDYSGEKIGKYLTPFLYFSVGVALLFALFSKEILYVFTAKSFSDAADIITVLSTYYALLFFSSITGLQLIFMKKTYITSLLVIFTIGLNVLIAIPLTKSFGAIGAAWALLFVGIISGTVSFIIAQRLFAIKWEYGKVISIFCVLIFSSLLILISDYYHISYLYCLSIKCLALVSYLYIGVKIKIITKESINDFMNILTFKKEKNIN
jgi:O-antigen/teichoic acid export membrane protein